MPLPRQEVDGTTPKYLRDKYATVGVGETAYTRGSGRTTRALATQAVRNAISDAGLKPADIDGMLSYQSGDSTFSPFVAMAANAADAVTSGTPLSCDGDHALEVVDVVEVDAVEPVQGGVARPRHTEVDQEHRATAALSHRFVHGYGPNHVVVPARRRDL